MPLTRTALYAQGVDLHIAIWPGGMHNTPDITRFIAMEGRSFVLSVNGLLRKSDIPEGTPFREEMLKAENEYFGNGGSCVAAPDGSWLLEPVAKKEGLFVVEIDHAWVRRERHNFDPTGHYSRPEVLSLQLDSSRQHILKRK